MYGWIVYRYDLNTLLLFLLLLPYLSTDLDGECVNKYMYIYIYLSFRSVPYTVSMHLSKIGK